MEEFEKIVLSILSPDSILRKLGEDSLSHQLQTSPSALCFNLISSLSNANTSHLCAVLFRRIFLDSNHPFVLSNLPSIKSSILSQISEPSSLSNLKKIADVLVQLNSKAKFTEELLKLMMDWLQGSRKLCLLGLYLCEAAAGFEESIEGLQRHFVEIMQRIWQILQSEDKEVRAAACKAVCVAGAVVEETDRHCEAFHAVILAMRGLEGENLCEVIGGMIELIENYPRVLTGVLDQVVAIMSEAARTGMNNQLKAAAVEVLIAIIRGLEGFSEDLSWFVQEVITLAMVLLAQVDNGTDCGQWGTSTDVESNNEPFGLGRELVCALSDILKEKVYKHLAVMIEAHLAAPHWLHQHTGLLALGFISEGCKIPIRPQLAAYTQTLCSFSQSSHPRLRWAALTSLGLFCTYFASDIQISFHQSLMQSLVSNINTSVLPKVSMQALRCVINFCNSLSTEEEVQILTPYASVLLEAYMKLMIDNTTSTFVLVELFRSLSAVALTINEFSQYAEVFLPRLRSVFYLQPKCDEELMIAALKCIGCIVVACAPIETENILEEILSIKRRLSLADIGYYPLLEVVIKCLAALEDKGTGYVAEIANELLRNACVDVDYSIVDCEKGDLNRDNEVILPLRGFGEIKVAICTEALENKVNSCRMLYLLIKSLKKRYSSFAVQTFEVVSQLAAFKMNEDVRKFSLKCMGALIDACDPRLAEELVFRSYSLFGSIITESSNKDKGLVNKILATMVHMGNKLKSISFIGLSTGTCVAEMLAYVIKDAYKDQACDPEDDIFDELLRNAVDIVGFLLKSFKSQFQPCFNTFFRSLIGEILYKPNVTETELVSGICLFCDYVEHTGDLLVVNNESILIKEFLKYSYHQSPDVRQCAIYGIGLSALSNNANIFPKYLDQSINACTTILNNPKAFNEDCLTCTECAIGTLGKLAFTYKEDLIPLWLKYLPLRSEPQEAQAAHDLFLINFNRIRHYPDACAVLSSIKQLPPSHLSSTSSALINSFQ